MNHDFDSMMKDACGGSEESLTQVISHFSPVLMAHARWALGDRLRRIYDPEDLVAETWAVALPKFCELELHDRGAAVIAKFLSTTMVQLANGWIRKHLVRRKEGVDTHSSFSQLPESRRSIISSVMRREREQILSKVLSRIDDISRTVLILSRFERRALADIALLLSLEIDVVRVHLDLALARVRAEVPRSIFDDVGEPPAG